MRTQSNFIGKKVQARASRARLRGTGLGMALALWVCVMVPLAAVLLPLAGWGVLAPVAVGLLVGLLFVCTLLCRPLKQSEDRWAAAVEKAAAESGVTDRDIVTGATILGGPRRRGARLLTRNHYRAEFIRCNFPEAAVVGMTRQKDYLRPAAELGEAYVMNAPAKGLLSPNEFLFFYVNVLGRKSGGADSTALKFTSTRWAN